MYNPNFLLCKIGVLMLQMYLLLIKILEGVIP